MRAMQIFLGAWMLALLVFSAAVSQDKASPSHETYTYDTTNSKIMTGIVLEVRDYKCPVSGAVGSHITLKRSGEIIEVHLGPATFLKEYEIVINKGDEVTIEAAPILFEGKPALLAKTVADGKSMYAFRDARGRPLW